MAIKLHASCAGDGEPVILLHGLFGSGKNLGALARELQSDFSVCSLDLPNHGRSEWLQAPTLATMADAIAQWMDAQQIPRAHFVGHSLGGKIAMELALAAPERVLSLVAADIAPVAYGGGHDAVFAALDAVAAAECRTRDEVAKLMEPLIEEEGVAQFLMTSLRRDDAGILRWRLDLRGLHTAYAQLIAAPASGRVFSGPVLFIKGADSPYIREEHWPRVQAFFPAATIKVMAGCGHWLHAQKPALFNSIVQRFLQSSVHSGASND